MYTAISILIVLASILLTFVVLIQNSKGGGLAANFAGANQVIGARQTADFLEKATWTLAIAILVLCLLGTTFISTGKQSAQSDLTNKLMQTEEAAAPQIPASTVPATDAQAPETPAETPAQK